jgi:hypothetical protein
MDAQLFDPSHPQGESRTELAAERRVVVLSGEHARAPYPFSSQNGNQLLLLDLEDDGWVFAELRFDTVDCRYAEIRRATYTWSREAIGALLSRALSVSENALIDTVERLDEYTRSHYGFALFDA